MKKRSFLIALAALALVIGAVSLVSNAAPAQASTTHSFYVTLYGWPDNSPPGAAIAYPKNGGYPTLHNTAGGSGTYSNPVTYATDKSELPVGTKVYYSYLKRYFIMEDDCTACDEDWTGQGPDGGPGYYHIDLWAGGAAGDNASALFNCEDSWTSNGQVPVIVDPPSNEPVANNGAGGSVFNTSNNTCTANRCYACISARPCATCCSIAQRYSSARA